MSKSKPSPLRRQLGYREIADTLRREILSGTVKPGQQLPTRQRFQEQFQTSKVTVQNALDVLAEQGFVRAEGRRGTFVQKHPPHLSDYALVFPSSPETPGGELWSRLYATLSNQATALSQTGRQRLIPFYGLEYGVNAVDYPRLLARVESHRLAGIIFASPPFHLANTPVLDQPGIPRVALMTKPCSGFPHVLAVSLGSASVKLDGGFWQKALDYLAARGRKRVAVLTLHRLAELRPVLEPLLAARGMALHPCGLMPFGSMEMEGAGVYLHALMQARDEARADAVIISDDNLVESALAGLNAAGVRVGAELDIIAHCNFPWAGLTVLPLKRLGFDSRAVLQTCIELIDRQRRGEIVPPVTTLAAKFEEELATNKAARELSPAQHI